MTQGHWRRACSVARTLDIVADPWTFLVMREAWFGVRRFDQFRANLGMPRGTLSARLEHLVREGLFRRVRYQSLPDRFEYRMTRKGGDLYPSMVVMMHWGDRWLAGPKGPPLRLRHLECGQYCHGEVVCSHCGGAVVAAEVTARPGPGAEGGEVEPLRGRTRRSSKPENFLRARPCSVARTLRIIGDRWTFLLIREAFFGAHRFDEVRRNLGISTNILTNRLQRLVSHGIFRRRQYALGPARFEYRLTDMGKELYPSLITLMRWGDKWLADPAGPPLVLHHDACDHDFHAEVVCSHCHREINQQNMTYSPGPGAGDGPAEVSDGDDALAVASGRS